MRVADPLGSFSFFLALWASMMAAMMLPGAVPSVLRCARAGDGMRAAPFFVGSYLAVWIVVGVAVNALFEPPRSSVAGFVVIAAGLYELTPLKAHFHRLCRANARSGFAFVALGILILIAPSSVPGLMAPM